MKPLNAHYQKRMRAERRFIFFGRAALGLAVLLLVVLLASIVARGWSGFITHEITLEVPFDAELLQVETGDALDDVPIGNYWKLVQASLRQTFPDAAGTSDEKALFALLSLGSNIMLRNALLKNSELLGQKQTFTLPLASRADMWLKGKKDAATLNEKQVGWLNQLKEEGRLHRSFNTRFFAGADSRMPERAGFAGAIVGSLLTVLVCIAVAFLFGVMTAVYLEEFAKKNWLSDVIELNINNLAAVPSIVFGLLGLAVYLNVMHLPRSAPVVGGLTLAMMILPVMIITTRTALKAVPDTIRNAARALGASPVQVVWHHTLPLAMPGIMTGTILGIARAMGETAPLLMIGMVAFIANVPTGFTDPATVMPVQIYLWASSPEVGYVEKTAAGIMVLLAILLAMNAFAIYIRKRFEIKW